MNLYIFITIAITGLLAFNFIAHVTYGQNNNTKLDTNYFFSAKENEAILENLTTLTGICQELLFIENYNKTQFNQYADTCLRYSGELNTMLKTFQNSTKTDALKMDALWEEWNQKYNKQPNK
jgi:hypothetical protein